MYRNHCIYTLQTYQIQYLLFVLWLYGLYNFKKTLANCCAHVVTCSCYFFVYHLYVDCNIICRRCLKIPL